MSFTDKQVDKILTDYNDNDLSTYVIAEKYGTYPNKISRLLKKQGTILKDKSAAQKAALKSGRLEHPTEGKTRTDDVKVRISEGVYKYWQNISQKEYAARAKKSKELWKKMSAAKKAELRELAGEAVRKAAKEGSKIEKFLCEFLRKEGYNVTFHMTGLIENDNLEIDLFIPELKTAIEIDGPAHFFPIWGQKSLDSHIAGDAKKAGLLLQKGMVLVRIKHVVKNVSERHKREMGKETLAVLEEIKKKFPSKNKRFIELEIK